MRKAIEALASDNLVVRRQGKGTFVTTHTEEKTSTFRFLRIRRNDGHDEYPASRLLDVRRSKASADIARLLELKAGDVGYRDAHVTHEAVNMGKTPITVIEVEIK